MLKYHLKFLNIQGEVDGMGVMKLLEIIRNVPDDIRKKIKFYQAGTSELYGDVLETPQNENTPFNPSFTLCLC